MLQCLGHHLSESLCRSTLPYMLPMLSKRCRTSLKDVEVQDIIVKEVDGHTFVDIKLPSYYMSATDEVRCKNLISILDGYFEKGGMHLNINCFNRDTLIDAMNKPHLYPSLVIRVSGYSVLFSKLSREQQLDVIARTFHATM